MAVVSLHSRTSAAAAGPSFWNSVGFPALWLNDELLTKGFGSRCVTKDRNDLQTDPIVFLLSM